jgi:TolB-like protein
LLVVSVVAIGYFAFDKFVLAPRRDAALVTQTKAHITAEISTEAAKVNPNSIAVLPFVNMSGDPNNEYFSDGISEEILNVLAQIPKLQVAARTSSFSFKGAGKEVPEIAKELKVRMVLEGSVRKQGERVRITAQLIDAGNGFHVWSQAYDRDLKDIFAIQDEIAKAIADELKVKLRETTALGKSSTGTRNLAAYDLGLQQRLCLTGVGAGSCPARGLCRSGASFVNRDSTRDRHRAGEACRRVAPVVCHRPSVAGQRIAERGSPGGRTGAERACILA